MDRYWVHCFYLYNIYVITQLNAIISSWAGALMQYAHPETARVRILNPVSGGGGQCHLIHLTILRRFSWPSLI